MTLWFAGLLLLATGELLHSGEYSWLTPACYITILYYFNHDCIGTVSTVADKPTLPTLITFPLGCSYPCCINIASRVGKEYWKLGILLLKDDNGHIVDAIVSDHRQDGIEMIILKIFQKWIDGVGQKPVNWGTLVTVFRHLGLDELARQIQENTKLY